MSPKLRKQPRLRKHVPLRKKIGSKMGGMISLDTETTGLDLRHGAKPFLVTTCNEDMVNCYWEWDVDPLTRQPIVPVEDLHEINDVIASAETLVLQNPKFDYAALRTVMDGKDGRPKLWWDWSKVRDTLLAGHLLASNQAHDLTTMTMVYLNINVQPFEDRIKAACNEARRVVRSMCPDWRIASPNLPEMPSAKGTPWKYDMWLPRAIAKHVEYVADHLWWTLCSEYANSDSATTLPLYKRQLEIIEERGLLRIYEERLKVLPIVVQMENKGITLSGDRLDQLCEEYREEADRAGRICVNVAKSYGHELELPKSGNNKSLAEFVFGETGLSLDAAKVSKKTGAASLDKATLDHYIETLPPRSKASLFVTNLKAKRKRDTALSYMESYRKYWLPLASHRGWYKMHPSLNPTGTDTLRWSSQNPNEQNISKQEGFNLRYCFGPAPEREWWSLDAKNIELRLPAYEAGETEMIALFERPDDPPYFGSNHLLVCHILHPKKFEECVAAGESFKDKYKSTLYQWVKNGNFAVQYGAVEESGTADRAYHVKGAQHKIQRRFYRIKKLNEQMIKHAKEHGYVETIPDKTVDPDHGYPLLCTRSRWGDILPTVPLNYHIQGSAMWWMMKAMIRCQNYLDELNCRPGSKGYFMVMQVHDELVFDFPKGGEKNLPKMRQIKRLMEQSGDDFGIPTPVSMEYHSTNWSEGISI